MSFTDLFEHGAHNSNVGHFAAMVTLAESHGAINNAEEALLQRFARKLDITDQEYDAIMASPKGYPISPPSSSQERMQRMLDLFKVILADHTIEPHEKVMIHRYAIALGYNEEAAKALIDRSIAIFTGGMDLEDYKYLLQK